MSSLTPEQWNYVYLVLSAVAGYALKHFKIQVPLVHQLLEYLAPTTLTAPGTPALPGAPSAHPILDGIMRSLSQVLNNPNATPADKAAAVKQTDQVVAVVAPLVKPTVPPV